MISFAQDDVTFLIVTPNDDFNPIDYLLRRSYLGIKDSNEYEVSMY